MEVFADMTQLQLINLREEFITYVEAEDSIPKDFGEAVVSRLREEYQVTRLNKRNIEAIYKDKYRDIDTLNISCHKGHLYAS